MPTIYSPPTPTYTQIATATTTADGQSIEFSSLPSSYRDLVVVVVGTTSADGYVKLQFNNDTTANYPEVDMVSYGGIESFYGVRTGARGFLGVSESISIFEVMDYTATDKDKCVLINSGADVDSTYRNSCRWNNTNAITTIDFLGDGTTVKAGTVVSIFGIEA